MIAGLNPLLVISTAFTVATVGDTVAVPVIVDTDVAVSIGITVPAGVITGVISAGAPPVVTITVPLILALFESL
jgi:hypothetical protein